MIKLQKVSLPAAIIAVVVVSVLAVGGLVVRAYQNAASTVVENSNGGVVNINNPQPDGTVPTPSDGNLGATGSPDIPYNYLNVNGFRRYFYDAAFQTATNTVCSFRSPAATSTLTFASANFNVSSTSASSFVFAKASTAYATTTAIGTAYTIAANAQATIIASTTASEISTGATVFAPYTYLNCGMAGGTGTFSPTGRVKAMFTEVGQ